MVLIVGIFSAPQLLLLLLLFLVLTFALFANVLLLLSGIYETSISMGLLNLLAFVYLSGPIERAMGAKGIGLLLLFTTVSVQVSMMATTIALYAATQYDAAIAIHGSSALVCALIVRTCQIAPERSVLPVRFARLELLKYRHLPALLCTSSALLWAIGNDSIVNGKEAPMHVFALYASWLWLRFFAYNTDTQYTGDLRQDFSLSLLFPGSRNVPQIRIIVDVVGSAVYLTLKSVGVFAAALRSQQLREQVALNEVTVTASPTINNSSNNNGVPQLYNTSNSDHYKFTAVDPLTQQRRLLAIAKIDAKLAELQAEQASQHLIDGTTADIDINSSSSNIDSGHDISLSVDQLQEVTAQHAGGIANLKGSSSTIGKSLVAVAEELAASVQSPPEKHE